jgi:hypothetical protein
MHDGFANPNRSNLSLGIDHNDPLLTTWADLLPYNEPKQRDLNSMSLPRQKQHLRAIVCRKDH